MDGKKPSPILYWTVCVSLAMLMAASAAFAASMPDGDHPPDPEKILFWTPEEQFYAYRHMERIFPYHTISAGKSGRALPLPTGKPLKVTYANGGVDEYMERNHVFGLLVLHNGKIVLEKYRGGFEPAQRWTSFSMAKSIASLLVGAAEEDGLISLDAPVSRYIPELGASAYAQVSVRQLISMTSGVGWNENYQDKNSDVGHLSNLINDPKAPLVEYMSRLHRVAPPGTVFNYSSGETLLVGELVRRATGKSLADYLSEKIWSRLPMEKDAIWVTDPTGNEVTSACFSATLRDYGRIGLFTLGNGKINGRRVLPPGWMKLSTTPGKASLAQGQPYGYLWWATQGGGYQASGIFGQMINVDPKLNLVIVSLSAWPKATEQPLRAERREFMDAVKRAVAGK